MAEPVVTKAALQDVLVVTPSPLADGRGFFVRTLSADVYAAGGIDVTAFVQENQSRSRLGTIRGLHGRQALSENKLVRCARGRVFEAIVDLRPWSTTFGSSMWLELDDVRHLQVLVPAGCVHGFQALTEEVDICYKHDAYYEPSLEMAVAWDDPELAIPWPLPNPILSDRDRAAPSLREIRPRLAEWYGETTPGA